MREQFTNTAQSSISNGGVAITSGATSLPVLSAAAFPAGANFRILVESELMLVTAVVSNTFTVTRALEGTTAVAHADGVTVTHLVTAGGLDQTRLDNLQLETVEGRLTLTSGTPVTTGDVTGASTIYFTPYRGNRIALYSGSEWLVNVFSETSLALGTLTSGLPYDVFGYESGGTLTLQLLAWSNGTTRATALTTQDGVLVKSGDATKRYLGTFYTTATTTTEDSALKRFLWNYYNRSRKRLARADSTASWTYGTATWRQANANAANQVDVIVGWAEAAVELEYTTVSSAGTANTAVGIGVNATNANSADRNTFGPNSQLTALLAAIRHAPAVGHTFYAMLEIANGVSATFYGTASLSFVQTGMSGTTDC